MQFLAKNNEIKVIELNLRASRSFPFVSKVTGHNFIEIATQAGVAKKEGRKIKFPKFNTLDLDYVAVKAPQFSFSRLRGADPVLSVEMSSTGEVACFGNNLEEAFLTSMISTGFKIPKKDIFISIGRTIDKADFLDYAKEFVKMGFALKGTEGTAAFFEAEGVEITSVKSENLEEEIQNSDLLINIPTGYAHEKKTKGYALRRAAINGNVSLITNIQIAKLMVNALKKYPKTSDLEMTSIDDFVS